jgi:hypothetical protein
MKARSFLGSYLKKEDIEDTVVATISSATKEVLEEGERPKLVIHFEELDKGLVCNVTNINTLISILGSDDTDDWTGKTVALFVDPNVTFAGKRIGGVRTRAVEEVM